MVKDHSDSERGYPLPPHGQLFPINNKCSFICTIPQTGYHIPMTIDCASFIAMRTSRGMFNMSTDFVMVGVMVVGRLLYMWAGRKEMFYLTTHSTHFIYSYMSSDVHVSGALRASSITTFWI